MRKGRGYAKASRISAFTLSYALPLAQKRSSDCITQVFRLNSTQLITVMAVARDSHPNFPVRGAILSFCYHFLNSNRRSLVCKYFLKRFQKFRQKKQKRHSYCYTVLLLMLLISCFFRRGDCLHRVCRRWNA